MPETCLPHMSDNDLPLQADHLTPPQERSCFYERHFFKEGDLWKAEGDVCSMCSCKNGRPACEPMPCPVTNCPNPIKKKGDCCPSCYSEYATCSTRPLRRLPSFLTGRRSLLLINTFVSNCNFCVMLSDMSSSNDDTRGCELGGLFYFAGSSWYLFLHPSGFDKCTVYTCDVSFISTRKILI